MKIYRATLNELDDTAILFDKYRQFYEQAPDYDGCRAYLQARLENDESVIFVAQDDVVQEDKCKLVGFTQLYHTFCSVARTPIIQLYDLFVDPEARRQGVGRALMNQATAYAKESGASRLQLETGIENTQAQALYEALGYERETRRLFSCLDDIYICHDALHLDNRGSSRPRCLFR